MANKVHKVRVRKGPFGGELRGTLCNRLRVTTDGMNVTDADAEVTCVLCRKLLTLIKKKAAA